jgi:hypothetical protein
MTDGYDNAIDAVGDVLVSGTRVLLGRVLVSRGHLPFRGTALDVAAMTDRLNVERLAVVAVVVFRRWFAAVSAGYVSAPDPRQKPDQHRSINHRGRCRPAALCAHGYTSVVRAAKAVAPPLTLLLRHKAGDRFTTPLAYGHAACSLGEGKQSGSAWSCRAVMTSIWIWRSFGG